MNTTLESLDGVPEPLHTLFEEQEDGGYKMRGFELKEDVEGLKKALETERKRRKEAEREGAASKGSEEVDIEEYKRLKAEAEEREERKAIEKGEYEKLLAKRDEKHAAEIARLSEDLKGTRAKLEDATVSRQLRDAIATAGVRDELREAAELVLRKKGFEVRYDGAEPVGVFLDEFKQARPIDEFVTEWAGSDAASGFMPPDVKHGGGSTAGRGAGGAGKKAFRDMSETEKMDLADRLPPEEYAAIAAAAFASGD